MSTRFVRTVEVNGKPVNVEIIRDGFNVWIPEPPKGCQFEARREQLFGMDAWHYTDIVPNRNPRLILATIKHRAIFENEEDTTDHITWRIQKYLQSVAEEVITDGPIKS